VLADLALPAVGPTASVDRQGGLTGKGPRAMVRTNADEVDECPSHRKLPWALNADRFLNRSDGSRGSRSVTWR